MLHTQLYIDFKLLPDYKSAGGASTSSSSYSSSGSFTSASTTDPADSNSAQILSNINALYLGFGAVHFVNAFMYYWAWLPSGYRFYDRVMIPEVGGST